MNKIKLRKAAALLTTMMMVLSSFAMPASVFANESLDTPTNLVLNRGHIENLSFGGPMGLSWGEVDGRTTFTVFAFDNDSNSNPDQAYAYVDGIDALYLDVNVGAAFSAGLSGGPFWFRVQAAADDVVSTLSAPAGPFWYGIEHSDEFADDPQGSFSIFDNADIPVIVIDARRPVEREDQGNIAGDVFVLWPNALAVEEGVTHADFQNGVFSAWQNFIANDLTDVQRQSLNPDLDYRDIPIFVY